MRHALTHLVVFGLLWLLILPVMAHLMTDALDEGLIGWVLMILLPAAATLGCAALGARRSLSRRIQTAESLGLERISAIRGAVLGLLVGAVLASFFGTWLALAFWCLIGLGYGAVVGGFRPRLVRGKTVPNQGMVLTIGTSLRGAAMAVPLAAIVPLWLAAMVEYRAQYGDLELVIKWSILALVSFFVHFAVWFGALDLGKHYLVRALIGATRRGPWDFPRLLDDACRRSLMQRVGGGYMFVNGLLLDHFAALDLPAPHADEVHARGRVHAGSTSAVIAPMVALALIGAVMALVGYGVDSRSILLVGLILLGIGGQWLIVRSAVASALRANRRRGEDE